VSSDLAKKLRLGLEELATIREQLTPLISLPATSAGVIERAEFLAFRHLFRGVSIVLIRWEKLMPLLARVDQAYQQTEAEIRTFVRFIEAGAE
jgi:hypothetical protein